MAKPRNNFRLVSTALILFLLPGLSQVQGNATNQPPPKQISTLKPTIPLEQLISKTRKKHGNIVVHSTHLAGQEAQRSYIINFTDSNHQWMRSVYDARNGQLLDEVSLKNPMPVEKSLSKVQARFPGMTLLRTWLDQRDGDLLRRVELADAKHKRWEIIQDAYTGQILNEHSYDIKLNGKEASLTQVLAKARERHKGMVVLQTRSALKNNIRVHEILYLDENRIRRKMTVNTVTGEIMSDRITPLSPI